MDGGDLSSMVRMQSVLGGHSETKEQAKVLGITSVRGFSSLVKELEVANMIY
jgi:hypothetical protein